MRVLSGNSGATQFATGMRAQKRSKPDPERLSFGTISAMNCIRRSLTLLGFLAVALGAPRFAHATGEACTNDTDCTTGTACGGEVCDWTIGMKCRAATAAGSGAEGWCTTSANCKCAAEGATCNSSFNCTKTVDTGTGGSTGSAGAGSSTAGASTAGASSSTAGATSSAGTTSSSSSDDSSGGCSISERAPKNSYAALLGAACAAALVSARRRRRAA